MRLFDSGSATTFGVTGLEKMQPASALPPSLPPTVPSSAWSLFLGRAKRPPFKATFGLAATQAAGPVPKAL